jgi:DNA-binding MarR family transcriptional regulator
MTSGEARPEGDLSINALVGMMQVRQKLLDGIQPLLRPSGLSESTYNALRILRGAQPDGLRCQEMGDRLLARVPDVTRLADRLEKSGFVERARCPEDRRVCYVRIKPSGLELLASLDAQVDGLRQECFAPLTTRDMRTFNRLISKILGQEQAGNTPADGAAP